MNVVAVKLGSRVDSFVANSVVVMFSGNMNDAVSVFIDNWRKNLVSWSSPIVGFYKKEESFLVTCQADQIISRKIKHYTCKVYILGRKIDVVIS
ncbi:hypothetical protein AtEden1_Chr5g0131751 [Arabidopsis thaliana]